MMVVVVVAAVVAVVVVVVVVVVMGWPRRCECAPPRETEFSIDGARVRHHS
jgi:hypothetical protein